MTGLANIAETNTNRVFFFAKVNKLKRSYGGQQNYLYQSLVLHINNL